MATATWKSASIEDLLTVLSGKNRVETVKADRCVSCDRREVVFRNDLSRKEYTISGLCQHCQDEIWPEDI